MKYYDLVNMLGKEGFFDLATVVQLTRQRRESLRMQLYRWCRAGKLIKLRRGMYAFPEGVVGARVNPALLANKLYGPSYISTRWAMGFYGLIPEKVIVFTSVTTRVTKTLTNERGAFTYRHVKKDAFFGYRSADISGSPVLIAEPEKALLDFWYLQKGEWGEERMREMRFQNSRLVDRRRLGDCAAAYGSPRLARAVAVWGAVTASEEEGTVEL